MKGVAMKLKTRWFKYKHCPVYENSFGDRVHISDDLVVIDGVTHRIQYRWRDPLFLHCLDIMGHNCRRALMLYVEKVRKI
jgi:hypothetical protein